MTKILIKNRGNIMSLSGISPASLLLIFLIILIIFGTKKLRNIGEDLGHAFHGFRKGLKETEKNENDIKEKK